MSSRWCLIVTFPPGFENYCLALSESARIVSFAATGYTEQIKRAACPFQSSSIITCCWKHQLLSAQMLLKGAHKHFDFTCQGPSLSSHWKRQNCPVFSKHIWLFWPVFFPQSTQLFEQPPQEAATPLIHTAEVSWIKEDTLYKWGLISVWSHARS